MSQDDAVRIVERKWLEDDRVYHAHDRSRRTHPQRQRRQSRQGKARAAAKLTAEVREVLSQRVDPSSTGDPPPGLFSDTKALGGQALCITELLFA